MNVEENSSSNNNSKIENFNQEINEIEKRLNSFHISSKKDRELALNKIIDIVTHSIFDEENEETFQLLASFYFELFKSSVVCKDRESSQFITSSFQKFISIIGKRDSQQFKLKVVKFILKTLLINSKQISTINPQTTRRLKFLPQNTLLSWSLILLSNNIEIFKVNTDLLNALFQIQLQLCENQTFSQLHNNQNDFNIILTNKVVFGFYLNNFIKGCELTSGLNLIVILMNYMKSQLVIGLNKEELLGYYGKVILGSTTPMKIEVHECFKSLFHELTIDDLEKVILPPISRLIKRSQDPIFQILLLILENTSKSVIFTSTFVKTHLLPLITPVFTSTTLDRKFIKKAFTILSNKSDDIKIISSIVTDDLSKPLNGPGTTSQKLNILSAINSFSQIINTSNEKLTISKLITASVTTYLEKEFNKINRIVGFKVLGNYLKNTDILTDAQIKLFTNSLKNDDDSIKAISIRGLAMSLGPNIQIAGIEKKLTQINQFTDQIQQILKNIKNPKTCDTGITTSALLFVLNLSLSQGFSQKMVADKNNIQLIYGRDSFIHQFGFLSRSTKKDHVIDLLVEMIKNQQSFTALKQSEKSVYSSVIHLLVHSQWQIRQKVVEKISQLHENNLKLSDLLFNEFVNIIIQQQPQSQQVAQNPNNNNTSATTTTTTTNVSQYYFSYKLFKGILSKNLSSEYYPSLVLYSHHPLIKDFSWKLCCSMIQQKCETILQKYSQEIVSFVFKNGLEKRNELLQEAFQNTINNMVQYRVPVFLEAVIQQFTKSLSLKPISQFNALQWSIYNTQDGELYQEKKETQIQNKTDRKAPKKKSAVEEKEEELKKRAEEKKRQQSGEAKKEEEERQRQIQSQRETRNDIFNAIRILNQSMDTIDTMVRCNPSFIGEFMSPIIVQLFNLAKNEVSNLKASQLYEKLQSLIPKRFKLDRSFTCFFTFVMNNIYFKSDLSDIQILSSTQKILNTLKESISREGPLNGFTLNYFWPILKNSLEKTISFSIQELSMDIIEKHISQSQPYPRGSMIASLIVVVATSTRLEASARNTIFQLISGVEISDISELMEGLISPHHQVRSICLQAIEKIPAIYSPDFVWEDRYKGALWFVKFDSESSTSTLADKIWNSTNQKESPSENYMQCLQQSTFNSHAEVRKINALAVKSCTAKYPETTKQVIEQLSERYQSCYPEEIKDTSLLVQTRISVATVFSGLGNGTKDSEIIAMLFDWIINVGLFDPKEEVVQEFTQTGMSIISDQGKVFNAELLKTFETFLEKPDDETGREDSIRATVAIFMGALAKHMEATNPKLTVLIDKLVATLSFPSHYVQASVAKCITQLIPTFKSQGDRLIPILLEKLKGGTDSVDRRGAAFGLAGTVKGLGISSLKNYDLLNILQGYVEDKKHPTFRQGALFAFECLSNILGRVFEPYVIQILPKLLICFGDSNADVREATSKAARAIMSQLSGHGVKIVLPALLKALDDRSWRTKEGSIELLGAMAFCAPKQLSTCLPTIVPKLTYVLNDTHTKVQEAAKEALSHIGSVIRNPEIQIHVPLLLKTYDEPELHSKELLENLLSTNYVHTIDPASLSLVMPILERTLKERSSELKKMSCQIIGNLCSLTEPKELIPYINSIMPVMKNVLLDQIPEVRAICSRAIGLLVKGIGEDNFTTLIPWLLETVKSNQGAVERSGAAQGLSEVLASLDISRFNSLLGEFLTLSNSPKAHVREGIMSIFIFTPISLGDQFLPYLGRILPQVLKGLADDSDPVREVCMRCGQSIVGRFAVSGIEVIVPSLERVLFHENWRIRLSTIQLFGDLLFKLAGQGQSMSNNNNDNSDSDDEGHKSNDDSDDENSISASGSSTPIIGDANTAKNDIYKLLGKERLDRILSSLYMMRFDNNASVRQKVLLIWKFIVNNTPKTLREILPTLIEMIIASIGSHNVEKRQVSARTLGDVVSKLTDRILPEILPILEKGLDSEEEETRQGVCIGLSEVISSARTYLLPFLSSVVACISKALYDPLIDVREAAAKAFDHLFSTFGSKASNEILPTLINLLDSNNAKLASNALDGLRQVILVKSSIVLPVLIPKLLQKPISSSNVRALSNLASDAGEGLYTHLTTIIPSMIQAFTDPSTENSKDIKESAIQICKSIKSEDGLAILIPLLIEQTEVRLPNIRLGACELIGEFANSNQSSSFETHIESLVISLLSLFSDPNSSVQQAANTSLGFITKSIKKENLSYLMSAQRGIQALVNEVRECGESTVPGFCLPKGLGSILPIILNGLMYGTSDQRELSTNTLYTVISFTTPDSLKPFVMSITGPLILVIGDKFPFNVKSAILQTLSLLITKAPVSMKIFIHQLQPTFIKALSDPHKLVRNNAASALGLLMTLSPSVDQLVNSLITGITNADSVSQEAKLRALQSIFDKKPKIDQANLDKAINAIIDFLYQPSDDQRLLVAQVIGASSKCFQQQTDLNNFIKNQLISPSQSVLSRYGKSLALGEVFKASGEQLIAQNSPHISTIIQIIQDDCVDAKGPIRESSAYLAEAILNTSAYQTYVKELLPSLSQLISDQSSSVSITSLQIIKRFSKQHPQLSKQYLSSIIPPTMNRLKERTNLPLKLAAERTLVHALQIFKESAVLDDYIKSLSDQTLAQSIQDYYKRILIKLSPDSDKEDDNDN